MREHPFYSDYFIPRVVSFSRAMGWPIVSTPAFEVPGDTSKASILWQQVSRHHTVTSLKCHWDSPLMIQPHS
jgi:hypothetical protein